MTGPRFLFDVDAVRALAEQGMTRAEAADKFAMPYQRFARYCRSHKIEFRHGSKVVVDPRAAQMAALYRSGQTLQQIGEAFGISRERVRQILRERTAVTSQDGGKAVLAKRRKERAARDLDGKTLARLGITHEEYRKFLAIGRQYAAEGRAYRSPIRAFIQQRNSAHRRGIGWDLTFSQWWAIWSVSGKWNERGRDGYVMCRKGDTGPYAASNVFIATSVENVSTRKNRKTDLPTGVSKHRNRFRAVRMVGGKKLWLGTFGTPEEASAAYLMANPSHPSHGVAA